MAASSSSKPVARGTPGNNDMGSGCALTITCFLLFSFVFFHPDLNFPPSDLICCRLIGLRFCFFLLASLPFLPTPVMHTVVLPLLIRS